MLIYTYIHHKNKVFLKISYFRNEDCDNPDHILVHRESNGWE